MLRTSSFLTIALSVAAIGSAIIPAAAFPLQAFGGGSNHLSQLPSAAPASTHLQASQEASRVLGLQKVFGAARDVEEIAMNLLGYQKIWLRCGLGTFDWEKQVASADAVQPTGAFVA